MAPIHTKRGDLALLKIHREDAIKGDDGRMLTLERNEWRLMRIRGIKRDGRINSVEAHPGGQPRPVAREFGWTGESKIVLAAQCDTDTAWRELYEQARRDRHVTVDFDSLDAAREALTPYLYRNRDPSPRGYMETVNR